MTSITTSPANHLVMITRASELGAAWPTNKLAFVSCRNLISTSIFGVASMNRLASVECLCRSTAENGILATHGRETEIFLISHASDLSFLFKLDSGNDLAIEFVVLRFTSVGSTACVFCPRISNHGWLQELGRMPFRSTMGRGLWHERRYLVMHLLNSIVYCMICIYVLADT